MHTTTSIMSSSSRASLVLDSEVNRMMREMKSNIDPLLKDFYWAKFNDVFGSHESDSRASHASHVSHASPDPLTSTFEEYRAHIKEYKRTQQLLVLGLVATAAAGVGFCVGLFLAASKKH